MGPRLWLWDYRSELARACKVHLRTAMRWDRGESPIPEEVWNVLTKLLIKRKELIDKVVGKMVSFDSYQSADSMQILRQKGFVTGTQSMDRSSLAYDVTKTAFYDGRIKAPQHEKALSEIVRLERDPKSGLIDHPPNFSKDCADAVAGVVYGLTYRREIWTRHRVPINQTLITLVQAMEDKEKKLEAVRR
jgi:hypothetical protein